MENPNKRYKTIGKVSKQLDIKEHVIRYWCSKFDGLYEVYFIVSAKLQEERNKKINKNLNTNRSLNT